MERQADTLRAELTSLQASARRSASFSADETRRRERKAVEMARTIAEEVDVLETELRTAASTRRRAEATLITDPAARPEATAVHVAAMQARAIEMEEANLSESVRQAAAQAAGNDLAVARTLAFSRPPGGQLEPRLLEVSGQGLAVLEPGTTEPRRFPGLGRAFNRWLASLDGRTVYVVVILRPSGLDLYDRVTEAVKDVGLQMGAELVGESMTVTFAAGSGE